MTSATKHIFPMHSNVIVIPHWIAENLHRYEVPLSESLNFKKIHSILSMNDLLSIVAAQSFGEMICGSKDKISLTPISFEKAKAA